jgi:hypothetical protein
MSPSTPFVDRSTGKLNVSQILVEAIPLAKLVGLFVGVALAPLVLAFLVDGTNSALGAFFTLVAQFVLAVGTGVVLLYVVVRGMHLAEAR